MALSDIDHIVVLMLENRSFDSMLGQLYPNRPNFDGLTLKETNLDQTGDIIPVWAGGGIGAADMSIPTPDPGELFTDINTQIFGEPNPVITTNPTMSGFVKNYQQQKDEPAANYDPKSVMHYYTPDQVPILTTLARNFAVSDRWHAAAPCQTWPNRFFVHTATANGYENNSPPHFPYDMPTIYTALERAFATWNIYFTDIPQSLTLSELWPKIGKFRFVDQFVADAQSGHLPNYSFIEPRYFADADLPSDQHPPHDITLGEQLIAKIYNAVRTGPAWAKTLLIITYDEHGGCFDHAPPPAATPPGPQVTLPFAFDRFGIRVPAVFVSPWIEAGTVARPPGTTPFDHTSIIATLRRRFAIPRPLTNRDEAAPDLAAILNLPTPRTDCPGPLSALPYVASPADVATARAAPLNGHQAALLQLAAHLPTTIAGNDFTAFVESFLNHLRTGATGADVSGLNNVASAVNFIKSRLGNFFTNLI
jgi:phospholipase C